MKKEYNIRNRSTKELQQKLDKMSEHIAWSPNDLIRELDRRAQNKAAFISMGLSVAAVAISVISLILSAQKH